MSWPILREYLRYPRRTGAIAASSTSLARVICSEIGIDSAENIVEYGPGTGVFTREILTRKRPEARFCAFEVNRKLARRFRGRFPGVALFEESAAKAPALLATVGMGPVDSVICGLPWAAFNSDLQDALLDATTAILQPGGQFATFAYLSGLLLKRGRQFRKKLTERFTVVRQSRVVWRNLPPAFVYRCADPVQPVRADLDAAPRPRIRSMPVPVAAEAAPVS